ncbi:Required for respiratory growth protein 9 mitochondrial [Ascosphaera aggregata]|nr:Required for respiratory growth protein 9 mitochondrial [Ascosphaera aggregata]
MSGGRSALKLLPFIFTTSKTVSSQQFMTWNQASHVAIAHSSLRVFSSSSFQLLRVPVPYDQNRVTGDPATQQVKQQRALTDDDYIPWEFQVPVEEETEDTQQSVDLVHEESYLPQNSEEAIAELQAALHASQVREAVEQKQREEQAQQQQKKAVGGSGLPRKKGLDWKTHRQALKEKFPEGWLPRKKVSPDTMELMRAMHHADPVTYSTPNLSQEFKLSPEAVRRILKSNWRPTGEEAEERRERWEKREARIWAHMAELGLRPKRQDTEPFSDAVRLLEKNNKKQE